MSFARDFLRAMRIEPDMIESEPEQAAPPATADLLVCCRGCAFAPREDIRDALRRIRRRRLLRATVFVCVAGALIWALVIRCAIEVWGAW